MCGDFLSQAGDVLCVVEDLDPFRMLVRFDSVEPFQHFVVLDFETTCVRVQLRQQRCPNRMRMQHGPHIGL